ncbi:hypothetical protein BDV95DRAFT_149381 [Massariosphaeria phaeospora]|uniref:CFEM domain-containing protein n=1 Tax=Massariosphaeria phaeospora TaxID=100035 RepID=A0A7C8MD54_9PLEO|nr:hypothetical protein BDV95DRAFT_149381 [Massariosphaeria phaeospora]
MRFLLTALLAGASAVVYASPVAAPQEAEVSSIGQCPQACWDESEVQAGCDPNADNACLCGVFLDAVTACLGTCSIEENLAALDVLQPSCP